MGLMGSQVKNVVNRVQNVFKQKIIPMTLETRKVKKASSSQHHTHPHSSSLTSSRQAHLSRRNKGARATSRVLRERVTGALATHRALTPLFTRTL